MRGPQGKGGHREEGWRTHLEMQIEAGDPEAALSYPVADGKSRASSEFC